MGVSRSAADRLARRLGLKSPTVRGGVVLIGATALAQGIILGVTPLLARSYDPGAFGYLSLVLAASSIVAPAACLKLESALLLPKSGQRATALFVAGTVASVLISLGAGLAFEFAFVVGLLPELAQLPHFAWWVAVLILFTAAFSLVSQLALRGELYGVVARRNLHQAVVASVGQVGLSFVLPLGGLVTGQVLGRLAGVVPVLYSSRGLLRRFRPQLVPLVLRRYWKFPAVFTPSALLNALGLGLPLIFIGSRFGVEVAGQWGMADRLLAAPVILVGLGVGQVLEARLAAHRREGVEPLTPIFMRSSRLLAISGGVLVIGLWLFGDLVLPWILGPGWEESVTLAMIIVISTGFRLVAGPISKVLVVLQCATANLALDAARVVLLVAAMGVSVWRNHTVNEVAMIITLTLSLIYVVTWFISWQAVRGYDASRLARGG